MWESERRAREGVSLVVRREKRDAYSEYFKI